VQRGLKGAFLLLRWRWRPCDHARCRDRPYDSLQGFTTLAAGNEFRCEVPGRRRELLKGLSFFFVVTALRQKRRLNGHMRLREE